MIPSVEYQILSEVLQRRLPPKATGTIVLAEEPWVEGSLPSLEEYKQFKVFERFPSLEQATVINLLAKEQEPEPFAQNFSLSRSHRLLSRSEAQLVFRGRADWEAFYERFPNSGGMFYLSRVGLNESESQALVHTARQWLGRAGGGALVFLERGDGKFVERGEISTWVS
jgi:hypothetical protein